MLNRIFGILGRSTRAFLADTGALARLGAAACSSAFIDPFRGGRLRLQASIVQAARAGNGSLPLVGLICFLVGMIMALQAAQQLRQLGATDLVAGLVAISITRELAPLLVAIIVAGRFGSAVAAELGTMQVSQEIDALNVMGIDPISFLVVPRLLALIASLPCLIIFADVIGILGGQAVATGLLGIGGARYLALTLDALVLEDIYTGLVKGIAFAGIIGLVSCHQGLSTRGGAEQVGHSTTASVVHSIVLVIGADLFVTVVFYLKA